MQLPHARFACILVIINYHTFWEITMHRAIVALIAIAALPQLAIAQENAVGYQVETSSGVSFPTQITIPGGGATHVLAGAGVRTKTFLKVKVYAFGIYVDEEPARNALSSYVDRTSRDLSRDESFYERILEMDFGMTLMLVMTRDVGGDDMADAFDGALRPRVQRAAAEMNMPGGEAVLDTFRGYFSVDEMTDESEMVFSCTPDGTLRTLVKGEPAPDLQSEALCWALFDVYLGERPISKKGKEKVVQNFPNILARGN